jgi:hypothetical protein
MKTILPTSWFPLSAAQILKFKTGEANEIYNKNSCRARAACGKLLGKRICLFPFQTPLFLTLDLILVVGKVAELFWRGLELYCCSPPSYKKFRATLVQALDYGLLLFLLPWIKMTEISFLACAALINPRIHFKRPEAAPIPLRAEYYYRWTIRLFEQLLEYKLNSETKASLHELENGVKALYEVLGHHEKAACFKASYDYVKQLRNEITLECLQDLKNILIMWAQKKSLPLTVRLPLIPDDEVVE